MNGEDSDRIDHIMNTLIQKTVFNGTIKEIFVNCSLNCNWMHLFLYMESDESKIICVNSCNYY